ncbi:MAG: hypothetical protein ACWA5P_00855 [bacterium]
MNEDQLKDLEKLIRSELLMLNIKYFVIKKAVKRFDIPRNVINSSFYKVRSELKIAALGRGVLYLFLSSIFLYGGLKTIASDSEYIFIGGLLFGSGGILTAIGYFILAIKGFNNPSKI